ncbi:MAG: hypothetical protein JW953_20640 [Anaerolineae bacterium]|nr:hypothetical protein [Anaerolineae bacterium]
MFGKILRIWLLAVVIGVFVGACAGTNSPTTVEQPAAAGESMAETDEAMMAKEEAADEMMMEEKPAGDEAMMVEKDTSADEMMSEEMMSDDDTTGETAMSEHSEGAMATEEAMDEMMGQDEAEEQEMMGPAWFKAELTNVNTGETFSMADLQDKVVLVETLAVWCSNCLKQQQEVAALHQLVGERDDFVSVGVDIDLNEDAAKLKAHTDKNGFDWIYVVASPEVAREIGQLYGPQFLNPPATPMLIIDRQGEAHPLPFGIKDAQTLKEALEPFLNEG